METLLSRVATRPLAVRGRIGPRDPQVADRAVAPLALDLGRDGPLVRERFATLWSDTAALRDLATAKRAPLTSDLAAALLEYHRRLGASPASLASLDRLIQGEAVAAVAGQQPAPLGGPLYSLHKTASAVGFAAEVRTRTGIPCVPMFWMHGEDSDFAEIRSITLADPALVLHDLQLPASAHRDGGLLGGIPLGPLAALDRKSVV